LIRESPIIAPCDSAQCTGTGGRSAASAVDGDDLALQSARPEAAHAALHVLKRNGSDDWFS